MVASNGLIVCCMTLFFHHKLPPPAFPRESRVQLPLSESKYRHGGEGFKPKILLRSDIGERKCRRGHGHRFEWPVLFYKMSSARI